MNPKKGDIFLVPTLDGKFVTGQVIAFETRSLHCVNSAEINPILRPADGNSHFGSFGQHHDNAGSGEKCLRFLKYLNSYIVANIIRARFDDSGWQFLNYFDGFYLEGFTAWSVMAIGWILETMKSEFVWK